MINKIRKGKRAVSPVIATVLLISLVVAASAMVYFIVVPLLRGTSSVDFVTTQWFDSDGDACADLVYVTLQNSGSASSTISNISITIQNDVVTESVDITNAVLVVEELPLTMDVTARMDIAISFDPSSYITVGENKFRIFVTYSDGLSALAPENLNYKCMIQPLELTIINPADSSWVSGIIDPQVVVSGGYRASGITYDFILPDLTVELDDEPLATNIDSTSYADDTDYEIVFSVSDDLNQTLTETATFNIDNNAIGVDLSLNASIINQGDAIEASWLFTDIIGGAPLVNQTLVLSGDDHGSDSVFTSSSEATTSYVLTGAETTLIAEDDFTFTIYVKDAVGNLNSAGKAFSLVDILAPSSYIISPANDSQAVLSEAIEIVVYADDATGIDTTRFDIYFFSLSTSYSYLYQESVMHEATYDIYEKTWTLDFNSFILPDDNYTLITQVYDLSNNANGNSSILPVIQVDNDVLYLFGATVTDGRNGWFIFPGVRGLLTFNLESQVPSVPLTITKVKFDWGGSNRVDELFTFYDDTIAQFWLDEPGGPYLEDVEYDVASAQGGINITSMIDHHITIQFDYGDRPTNVVFTFSFYIESAAFTGWETFVLEM
ncbi:MAG: archaellin/type IV pilin N-terminal domain-containing protein [Candidatus Heimdallarchaeaceae archaeon]